MITCRPAFTQTTSFKTFVAAMLLACASLASVGLSTTNAADDVLATLRPDHSRLFLTPERLEAVRAGITTDPRLQAWYDTLQKEAVKIQDQPPVIHRLIGPRLLDKSRTALGRISTLAGLYRLDGDKRKLDRALVEMKAVAAFPDWNPSHFLDVAEMTNALAIGYDWLYDDLTPADRATIRAAIVDLGLKPGLKVYESGKGWPTADHNWNQVCNGGMAVGALSVADDEPELARRILNASRQSIVKAMNSFAPDGGWEEGPGYWNYATSYNVFYLDALQTALGTDFNLSQMSGFPVTGNFRAHSIGPIGLTFNYADASDKAGDAPQMFWLAHEFHRPADAIQELHSMGSDPRFFHLLWSEGRLPEKTAKADLPLDSLYRGINVAFFRSAWNDPQALYVGFKGGDNRANHSHLDLGTFVLDALGQRWAIDLGGDEYNLPGYFGGKRWTYYRLKTEGHNTVSIVGENQDPKAKAPIVAYQSRPNLTYAVADLTKAYGSSVRNAWRGVGLLDRKQVLVIDEIQSDRAIDLSWSLHTRAKVAIDGPTATLSQRGKELEIRLLDPPAGASFAAAEVKTPEPQRSNAGVSRLTLSFPPTTSARIAVLFTPSGRSEPFQIPRLEDWIKAGPLPPLETTTTSASK